MYGVHEMKSYIHSFTIPLPLIFMATSLQEILNYRCL